ncbi:PadR family transcriptional regulator [Clostridium taeniosporum]|uniref:PadR family transcriptional regulator n=1 Tax=Clostridium taeniosporum TaxID=394958 RepID=A0A1D7XNZ9_9CLOT|nr:PadR family transcriptional regulator [Clostridium taeniosporum]AOR24920.2 PadR family transcriptional regulator [Clostridium taeniosporum]
MKKKNLIKKIIDTNLKSKEQILEDILNVVKQDEKKQDNKYDFNILVLALIKRKDMYGYLIIKEMEIKSKGIFSMNEGELYPILHSLENDKFLKSYWKLEDNIEKKYYTVTKKGLKYITTKTEEIKKFVFLWNIEKI